MDSHRNSNKPTFKYTPAQTLCKLVGLQKAHSEQVGDSWYWHTDRNIDQWNKIESPEIYHAPMDTLCLTKEARIYNGEKTISLTSGAGETGQPRVKE